VEDTTRALAELARAVRQSWRCSKPGRWLAAVTGSAGKTTTKEILAGLLATRYRVLKSEGNLNNEYGLPLSLLRLEDEHDAVVVELGMNHRGEIARLAKIAEPEVGVVTCVAPVHLEFFASVDEIALAKRELIENLSSPGATAVLNADDERVARFADGFGGSVLTFGLERAAAYRAEVLSDRGIEGTEFDFVWPGGRARLRLPLPGRHNVRNALAALAAASLWGVGAAEAQQIFPALRPAAMRGEVLKFAEGFTVINDAYNSNPVALQAAVELLMATPGYRRRILAAGEMLELGPISPELHREAGRKVAARGVDWFFAVQGHARAMVEAAVAAGFPAAQAQFFDAAEEAGKFLADFVSAGDLLLVKGSRGVKMERIIEIIRDRHAAAPGGEA
jgi:UDP-N-acetylmuramoyl-tripeptide--D-alanyl-D-alanine ligase